jgi:hypothetical protein
MTALFEYTDTDRIRMTVVDYRGALEAVLDAIDLPMPATIGDSEAFQKLLTVRVMYAVIHGRAALQPDLDYDPAGTTAEYNAGRLRDIAATLPVNYKTTIDAADRLDGGR